MLRAKLMELKIQQHAEKISDIKGVQMKIEWGSQIRSYVFMPYQLVKDTRTGYETSQYRQRHGRRSGWVPERLPDPAGHRGTEKVSGRWAGFRRLCGVQGFCEAKP